MDSNLCAKFDLNILPGFSDTPVETEQQQQQQQENWKVFLINQVPIMRYKLFLRYILFVTIQISLLCLWLK